MESFLKLPWAISVHKAWWFAILLAILVQIWGKSTYFFCAVFCLYLLHLPSKILCCSSTIDHMEWDSVGWIEQLNHFQVIHDILNLLFKAQSTSAVGHLKVCVGPHQSFMRSSYIYISPCLCRSWSFVLFVSGICLI